VDHQGEREKYPSDFHLEKEKKKPLLLRVQEYLSW
jgi:hypothetical protein